ncbi:methionine ABC transporter ATP-binding protein [Bacillus coahuilensis]|uniref:methionine ABC transporter ATP-binding protein n=1 Tax=Bacillus coahuilensis TaxID=408580 RepID=UPI00075106DF|nr:ATP-binding cassette domain-containing protein [Bacillus coahuilensis]
MIKLQNVTKSFSAFQAIKHLSLTIHRGEIHGIIGASGAGKSTLLRVMNMLEVPDAGKLEVNGKMLTEITQKELREARKSIGMIFQHYHLVSNKTVYQNVLVSLKLSGYPNKEREARVLECLRFVGLESMQAKYPAQLSGGQKQRVAIARALANNPTVLLCDEPTSSLDPSTTDDILDVLQSINHKLGVTVVVVSHEMDVIKSICHRVTILDKGSIYQTVEHIPIGVEKKQKDPSYFVEQLRGSQYV